MSESTGDVVFIGVDAALTLLPCGLPTVEDIGGNGETVMILDNMFHISRQINIPTSIRDVRLDDLLWFGEYHIRVPYFDSPWGGDRQMTSEILQLCKAERESVGNGF
jgi:hypothetical protein